jgi:plastocyanin
MDRPRNPLVCGLIALTLALLGPLSYGAVARAASPPPGAAAPAAPVAPDALAGPALTVDVAQRDDYFDPADISVSVGTIVRWTNRGDDAHTTTSDNGYWNSGSMYPGSYYAVRFNAPGTYSYYCQFHRYLGMVGRVNVAGGTAPTPTPGPGPGPGGNLALGKMVRASSAQAGHPPELAVDGDLNTFWAAQPPGPIAPAPGAVRNNQWIYVDLGQTASAQRFHMVWTPGQHALQYGVYVYSGSCGWCQIGYTRSGDGDDTLSLTRAVSGRYFLLSLMFAAAPPGGYELREWEIFGGSIVPPPSMTNVALNRPARASSEQPGYEAARATDGNLGTEWRSGMLPAWIYVDFGRAMAVNRAVLRWATGMQASHFALYAWSGSLWYAVYNTAGGAGGDQSVSFPMTSTRYLLLNATAGPMSMVGLRELEVYGSTGGGPYAAEQPEWQAQPDSQMKPDVRPEGISPLVAPRLQDGAADLLGGMTLDGNAGAAGAAELSGTVPSDLPDPR